LTTVERNESLQMVWTNFKQNFRIGLQ